MTEVTILSEIVQIIKIVEKIDKKKESRLKPKTKVNHMNTRTTKNTMQISNSAQNELKDIAKEIIKLLNRNIPLQEIRNKLKDKAGSIIANAVRESYLLGFHFIESFEEKTIQLTAEHTDEINKEVEKQIDLFWNSVSRIISENKKKQTKIIFGAAGPADLFLLNLFNNSFAKSSISMSFFALNLATITTQRQVFKEKIANVGTVTGSIKVPQSIWVSERDNRVCSICLNFDGRTWDVDDSSMPRPVQDSHLGCRCRLLPLDRGTNKVFNA